MIIIDIKTKLFQLPLDEPLQDAMHGIHTHFELITVEIHTEEGLVGTGYTYTGGKGGHAIKAMLDHDFSQFIKGKTIRSVIEISSLNEAMFMYIHYVGRGGVASFAISAIDVAVWDLYCKKNELPLWKALGGASDTCRVYRGGIDLNYSLKKLLQSVELYLEQGFNAVKIKIGKKQLEEDIERVQAVRKLIGTETNLMVDANYSYTLEQALNVAISLKEQNILWLEEPVLPDCYQMYGLIAKQTQMPLAMGENLHTIEEFKQAFEYSSLSYIQPDASNCGGISNWIRIAKYAKDKSIPICSHGMHELHVSLVSSQINAGWLEVHSFPIDTYTKNPLQLKDYRAIVPNQSGIGIEFDWNKLKYFQVSN